MASGRTGAVTTLIAKTAHAAGTTAGLQVRDVHKHYGSTQVLKDISLMVPHNAFHTLLGPSGSGKTTLLRIIAGFTPVDSGSVTLAGADVTDMPPERRNTGVVFQNYALFPHMTVAQNIAFGLKMRGVRRDERARRVNDVLGLVRMRGFDHRYPAALSGGQQQRVALARALVIEPQLLLLDEPLSALDRKIRQEVREELKRIQAETRVTTVMVTHDQEEALYLADRVLVLDSGVLRQQGAPTEVYQRPADEFVAGFLGPVNLVDAIIERESDGVVLRIGSQHVVPAPELRTMLDAEMLSGPVRLAIRPEQLDAALATNAPKPPDAVVGTVAGLDFGGPFFVLRADVEGHAWNILALAPTITGRWEQGAKIWLRIKQARVLSAANAA